MAPSDLIHRRVSFKARDVYMPPPETFLMELHGEKSLQGRVVGLSDAGRTRDAFAVVAVDGLDRPVVVPVERVEIVQ